MQCSSLQYTALHCNALLYHLPQPYFSAQFITTTYYWTSLFIACLSCHWLDHRRQKESNILQQNKKKMSWDGLLLRSSFSSSFQSSSFLSDTDPYCCIRSIQSCKKVLPPLKIAPIEIYSFCWSWSMVKYLCNPLNYVNNNVRSKFKCNKNLFQSNTLPIIKSFTTHFANDQYFSSSIDLDCWKCNIW